MKRKKRLLCTPKTRKKKYFSDILVTVAVVIHNDQDILAPFLQEAHCILQSQCKYYEILVIDNGSTDRSRVTLLHLQKRFPNIRVLVLSRAYDQEIGYGAALENSIGDYVVLLDIACDPPVLIPKLVKTAQRGNDIVIAEQRDRMKKTLLERGIIRMFSWALTRLLRFPFQFNASYYRVFSRSAVTAMIKVRSKNKYVHYYNELSGFSQLNIPYSPISRRKQHRYENLFSLLNTGLNIIILNSMMPLLLARYLGIFAGVFNIFLVMHMFILIFLYGDSGQGWINASLVNTSMFFLIFVMLTIMIEYIGRVLNEPKEQPLYFVAEELNSLVVAETNQLNVE